MYKKLVMLLFLAMLTIGNVWAAENVAATVEDPSSCLYFAHPVNTYNTALEKKLLERIRQKFPTMRILNPNEPQYSEGWGRYQKQLGNPMIYFIAELMPSCTGGVIALPYRNGRWSPGVYLEMMVTYVADRPVWTINATGRIRKVKRFPSGLLSIKENRTYAHRPY